MQLSKTGRLKKIVGIFERVAVCIKGIVIALYYATRQFHKTVVQSRYLVLTGAIAPGGTLMVLFTGFLAVLLGFLCTAAVRTAIGATLHRGPFFRELEIRPEILRAQKKQAGRQYDCDSFHFKYKYNNFPVQMFKT